MGDQATQAVGSQTFQAPNVAGLGDLGGPLGALAGNFEDSLKSLIGQDTRLVELHLAADSGVPDSKLLAHRITGYEAVNDGFRFEVEVLSSDAFLELKSLEGVPIQVTILTCRGTKRQIHGVVTEAHSEGSDGSLAVYRLVIEPVTAALKLSRTSRIFLGKTDLEVVLQLLNEQLQDNPVFSACLKLDNRCQGDFPTREFLFQCDENTWDFLRRRLARIGVSFVFMPAKEVSKDGSKDCPQHTLVLFNDAQDLEANEAGRVRFHRADGTEQTDAITQWHARRTLQCGKVTRRAWDHNTGSLGTTTEPLQSDQGAFGNALASTLEDYRHVAPLEHDAPQAHEAQTVTHAQTREQRTKLFAGEGSVRDFRAGTTFALTQHPVHDQDPSQSREFVLTRVQLEAENNLPKALAEGLRGVTKAFGLATSGASTKTEQVYRNQFACLRLGIPLLPDEVPAPTPGLQTATVVGPEGSVVHTDELGRIKVRLHCARAEEHRDAGASLSDKDSFWIRLLQPWSSQGMGGNFLPRAGDEVAVSFLANDPDKPVIVGVLPGGTRKPGRFSDASALPGDKALSGLRSREHGGTLGNQVLFDDTPGELRAHIASDHAASELNLGFITSPRSQGSAQPRGEGAELRTDGTATIRAAKGLLLTAAAQLRAGGPQLAREELAQLFEAFGSLTDSLGNYAGQHNGLPPKTDPEKALQGQLKDWETGTNTKPKTQRPSEGQRLIALSAPDGLVAATPKTAVVYAGENLDLAAQQYAHLTVGQQLVVNAGKGLSLFSHKGGFKAIAHQDDMDIQAQHGDVVMTAAKNVKLFASENEILIAASKKITLMCGGSYITIAAEGIVVGGPAFTGKVGSVSWPGVDTLSTNLPNVGMGKTWGRFLLTAQDDPSHLLPDRGYKITLSDGRVVEGTSNGNGLTDLVEEDLMKILHIDIKSPEPLS